LAYGTPALVNLGGGQAELVIGVPGEIWGLNPDSGKLAWYALTSLTGNICPSPISQDGTVFVFGGYQSYGSVAIRAGGQGDVTDSHVVWTSRTSSYVATPLLHENRLYWVDDRGQAHCVDAKTGQDIYRERLPNLEGGGRPVYASPVLANGNLYVVSRRSGTYVLAAEPAFRLVAQNRLDDDSDFNGSPAVDGGQIFLRSNQAVYCLAGE
jgi:outer membrane protein assembly factor BamB